MTVWQQLQEHGPLDGAVVLDLEERGGRYYFRISGDDFHDAVAAVKQAFAHGKERSFDPATKEWSVPAELPFEEKLCTIFSNATEAFRILHSQMRMFDNI